MRLIRSSDFRTQCIRLMDELQETGEEVVITKNGHPVAKLVPLNARPKARVGGEAAGPRTRGKHRGNGRRQSQSG